jgi:hypothetical protein
MGWWRIDPQTGMTLEGASSALSRPPEFVLLNAVPDVDDEAGACFLGDGPSDMVSTLPNEVAAIAKDAGSWSADQVRELFLHGRVPAGVGPKQASELQHVVEAFWADINGCYEDEWERPALPDEKKWICEEAVDRLTRR